MSSLNGGSCYRSEEVPAMAKNAEDDKSEAMANGWAQLISASSPRGRAFT